MHSTEWSLVFFTTISQLATGIMIAILPFVFSGNQKAYAKLNQSALYFSTALMLMALVLSFLHLNNPLHSIYALSNLGTSWLSMEIFFVSLFLFGLVFISILPLVKTPKPKHYRIFIIGTTVVGIIMVYSMSMLYMIPTVPIWNSICTPISFFATALLLGSAFVFSLSLQQELKTRESLSGNQVKIPPSITFIAIAIIAANTVLFNPSIPEGNIAFEPQVANTTLLMLRWLTMLLAVLSLLLIIYKKEKLKQVNVIYYQPFIFFLISELIARAAFYESFYNIGM